MKIKNNPRNILNELKWKEDFGLDKAEIWYVHRGAPKNTKIISGREVVKLGRSFIETKSAMIPYHRVFKIVYKGEVVFKR